MNSRRQVIIVLLVFGALLMPACRRQAPVEQPSANSARESARAAPRPKRPPSWAVRDQAATRPLAAPPREAFDLLYDLTLDRLERSRRVLLPRPDPQGDFPQFDRRILDNAPDGIPDAWRELFRSRAPGV